MSIDEFLKITQIGFYAVMAAVAVLTYLKAKNTLLNSVNTEYHKHVIEALIKASNTLFSEFEASSPYEATRNAGNIILDFAALHPFYKAFSIENE